MKSYGKIISGNFNKIIIREKNNAGLELGELIVSKTDDSTILMQVYDLMYGSQLSQQSLELISGVNLESEKELRFFDKELRAYNIAVAKNLLEIKNNKVFISKKLPKFMSDVHVVTEDDLKFIINDKNKFFVGKVRSGSKVLNLDVKLNASEILKHHILIAATTGRGKSNLAKVLISNLINDEDVGVLVFDPHDEYYGRNGFGLKDYAKPNKEFAYYTPTPTTNSRLLTFNIKSLSPFHLNIDWSDAQRDALFTYYGKYKKDWIKEILTGNKEENIREESLAVIKRKLKNLLGLKITQNGKLLSESIFTEEGAENTIKDIITSLESGKVVVIDTSTLTSDVELLISSMITTELLNKYKYYKTKGLLKEKATISILLEEAPRVLNNESLQKGNIFSTIAREGRKFKIGLIAITQLPSSIPREILANMNTKIILGTEMENERQALINSASQDLSDDSKNIAALDKGEALITSSFTKFAIPVKIPEFKNYILNNTKKDGSENKKTTLGLNGFN